MSKGKSFKEVGARAVSKAAELLFRQNQSMESEDGSVGAGLLAIHEDRAAEKANAKREKEERESKSHNALMARLQARIDDLQSQIDVLQAKIDELKEEKTENKDQIAKNKERMAELKEQGKEDSAEYQALLAANDALNDRNDNIDDLINDYEGKKDDLNDRIDALLEAKATNDSDIMRVILEASSSDENYHAAHTDSSLRQVVSDEFDNDFDGGELEHEIVASVEVKEDSAIDFFGENLFLEAEKLEIAGNFAKAASGETKSPKLEQEITSQDPNQQISMNV